MMLQRHRPAVDKMLAATHDHARAPEDRHRVAESRAKVPSDWRKLDAYRHAGFIVPWPKDAP